MVSNGSDSPAMIREEDKVEKSSYHLIIGENVFGIA